MAFRGKQIHSLCFFLSNTHVPPPPPSFPSPFLLLEPLNGSVSFFFSPCEKALYISYLFVCRVFCSGRVKLERRGEGGNGPVQPTCAHFACSRYFRRTKCYLYLSILLPPLSFSADETLPLNYACSLAFSR